MVSQQILLTTDYIKMAEFFRFRSINALLGEYQELEKQNIYFASPEELNDPMEGFRDVLWCGDQIVWTNFFKHYAFCLHRSFSLFRIAGDSVVLDVDRIFISAHRDKPLTPQEQDLFNTIWDRFSNLPNIRNVIETLANTERKIRYREVVYYLQGIHLILLDEILKSHIDHGIMPETEAFQPIDETVVKTFMENLLKSTELTEGVENEKQLEGIFQIIETRYDNILFMYQYNNRKDLTSVSRKNELLLKFDFPKIYLENLKDMTFPKWWTACFTKSYANLSVWAKYADGHRGTCLIFKENINWKPMKYWKTAIRKVTYENKPIEIDFFRSIGVSTVSEIMGTWYKDEKGNISECASHIGDKCKEDTWREGYWNNFLHYITTKNRDWEYEQEYRVILYDNVRGVIEKSDHTLNYDFESLKGIIFGIRTSTEDKIKIFKIIERLCKENKRTDFEFFQAYYSAEKGDIRKYEIQLPFPGKKNILILTLT